METNGKSFEQNLERLEELSSAIKKSDITLEEALSAFEEGIVLAKSMENQLDKIERRVQELMNAPAEESFPEDNPATKTKSRASKKTAEVELGLFDESVELNGTRNG